MKFKLSRTRNFLVILVTFFWLGQALAFINTLATSKILSAISWSTNREASKSSPCSRIRALSFKSKDRESESLMSVTTSKRARAASFSVVMALCGAALGPFLDSYHSAFGVLQYEQPIIAVLWGSEIKPALTTAWWVPELFALAGFIIGWLYILLDSTLTTAPERRKPSPPAILFGISMFTFQYWLSGVLFSADVDRTSILFIMSALAGAGFVALDTTLSGLITSFATAFGGPLIEVGLLSTLQGHGGYQYLDKGETGFFPLWIVPVYFLGGPAVGSLARGFWRLLSPEEKSCDLQGEASSPTKPPGCQVCNDSRAVSCPNCDGQGYYTTYGRSVKCNCCKGRGLVICRDCFPLYNDDPNDLEAIRDIMAKMPD